MQVTETILPTGVAVDNTPVAAPTAEPQRKGVRPKYTHCDICGEPLPEEELRMQAVNHRDCWKKWVEEKRAREPEPTAAAAPAEEAESSEGE